MSNHVQSCWLKIAAFRKAAVSFYCHYQCQVKKNPQIVSSWCDVYYKNKETEKRLKAHMEYKVSQSPT